MASFSTLSGFDTTNFNLGTQSTIAAGVLTLAPSVQSAYTSGIATKVAYSLVGSAVSFRMNRNIGSAPQSNEQFIGVSEVPGIAYGFGTAQNILGWYLTGDAAGTGTWVGPVVNVAGVDSSPAGTFFTVSSANPLWLRVREASGTTFFETSRDGTTWTTQYSVADPLSTTVMGSMYFAIDAGFYNASDVGITSVFDKFNQTAGGTVIPRTISASHSNAPTVRRQLARGVTMTQSRSATLARAAARGVAVSQSRTPTLARAPTRVLSATHSNSPTVKRTMTRALSTSQSHVATMAFVAGPSAGAISVSHAAAAVMRHTLTARRTFTQSTAAVAVRTLARRFAASVTHTATQLRSHARVFKATGTQGQKATLIVGRGYKFTASASHTAKATIGRTHVRGRAKSVTQGSTARRGVVLGRQVSVAHAASGVPVRRVARALGSTGRSAAVMVRGVLRVPTVATHPTPVRLAGVARVLGVAHSAAVTLRRVVGPVVRVAVNPAISVLRIVTASTIGIMQDSGAVMVRRLGLPKGASVGSAGRQQNDVGRRVAALQSTGAGQRASFLLVRDIQQQTATSGPARQFSAVVLVLARWAPDELTGVNSTRATGQLPAAVVVRDLAVAPAAVATWAPGFVRWVQVERSAAQGSHARVLVDRRRDVFAETSSSAWTVVRVAAVRRSSVTSRPSRTAAVPWLVSTSQGSSAVLFRTRVMRREMALEASQVVSVAAAVGRGVVAVAPWSPAVVVTLTRTLTAAQGTFAVVVPPAPLPGGLTGVIADGYDGLVYPYAVPSTGGIADGRRVG